jgi:hypothetical protein
LSQETGAHEQSGIDGVWTAVRYRREGYFFLSRAKRKYRQFHCLCPDFLFVSHVLIIGELNEFLEEILDVVLCNTVGKRRVRE